MLHKFLTFFTLLKCAVLQTWCLSEYIYYESSLKFIYYKSFSIGFLVLDCYFNNASSSNFQ